MATSFLAHHPDGHVFVLLVDGLARENDFAGLNVTTVPAADLGVAGLADMRARYTTFELCNALKPYLLAHLLDDRGCQSALYLDSDIYVVGSLIPDAFTVLDMTSVLLTPHLVNVPGSGPDAVAQELAVLLRGALNGGFVGVRKSPDATQFLRWWSERVAVAGYHRLDRGMNCDQRWLDLVPGLDLDVRISKHPGLNVAYWNLQERNLSQRDGRWLCNEEVLRFVHFSGFPVDDPTALTRHWSRFNLRNRPDIAGLAEDYRAALRRSLAATDRSLHRPPRTPPVLTVGSRPDGRGGPDVTVIVPVHNGADFVAEAITSVLIQEGVDLEVVVVDDGSSDDLAAALPSDPRVSLLTTTHVGVSQARNKGLASSTGRMVVFLDADDAITDQLRLRDQLILLDGTPRLGIVHSGWEIVDSDGRSTARRRPWTRLPDLSLEEWIDYPVVLPSAMAFRREAIVEVGGFDTDLRHLEDLDIVVRLLLRGWRAEWLERVTTRYRRHDANASNDVDGQALAHAVVLDRLFSVPDLPPAVAARQRSVRYNSHVWLANRYYVSGRAHDMADQLAASSVFTDGPLGLLPLDWIRRFTDGAADAGEPPPKIAALTAETAWTSVTRLPAAALLERGMAASARFDVSQSRPALRSPAAPQSGIWRGATAAAVLPLPALDLSPALARSYGRHRSGWSAALQALRPLHADGGVLVDGFVEHTFCAGGTGPHRSPWIGFVHNPPGTPQWYPIDQSPGRLLADAGFQASLTNCLGLFTLSEFVGDWWSTRVEVPVETVPHPAEPPIVRFTLDGFRLNPLPRIVQVGTWLRKLHAINDLPVRRLQRTIVHQHEPYIEQLARAERKALGLDVDTTAVETLPYLDDAAFDELLSCNLAFVELYSAGANNAVVECMARATPILVNPLPAVREYLGDDYPFYFSSRTEAARKAEDLDAVAAAHDYLVNLPQASQLTGACFLGAVAGSEIYRSLRGATGSA